MVITSKTKNGITLYFEVNEDVFPNEGGYYCDVYTNEDCIFVYDSFVIKKKDLDVLEQEFDFMKFAYIQQRCDNYAKDFDDMSIINGEFNEVYEAISNAYSMLNDFYTKYVYFNKNCNSTRKKQIADMFDNLGDVKEIAHEVSKHYTWDELGINN